MYRTNSLTLASFLYSVNDVKFQGTELDDEENGKIYFLFEPEDQAKKLAKDFLGNRATADPFTLFQSHHALKDMIFETKRNNKK